MKTIVQAVALLSVVAAATPTHAHTMQLHALPRHAQDFEATASHAPSYEATMPRALPQVTAAPVRSFVGIGDDIPQTATGGPVGGIN